MNTTDRQTVHLQVKLFGHLRQTSQPPNLALDIFAGSTVSAVLWELVRILGEDFRRAIFDGAGNLHGGIEVVLNEEHLPARKIAVLTVQQDGNLYLVPMIEGG